MKRDHRVTFETYTIQVSASCVAIKISVPIHLPTITFMPQVHTHVQNTHTYHTHQIPIFLFENFDSSKIENRYYLKSY